MRIRRNERGVALITVMLILIIMTVIGIAALTVTGLENRMAGFGREAEVSVNAAESCIGTGVNIVQQTIDLATLPPAFLAPAGPVPTAAETTVPLGMFTLTQEIMGQSDNDTDTPTSSPDINLVLTSNFNGFTVNGDIDRLYAKPKAGSALQFAAGYEGLGAGAGGGGVDIFYRIDCVSTNTTTNTTSRISAVYACTATGESCQKMP